MQPRIEEAITILKALGFPRQQQNERSALTLLALLGLTPEKKWASANAPMLGITPMMEFFAEYYGKQYAPNSRETVRRQTVHQFLAKGLIVQNPDEPYRATNSGKSVYQIETSALDLLRTFGTAEWDNSLSTYLSSVQTLQEHYQQERELTRIPVRIAEGTVLKLSPGGQNVLVEQIIHEFAPRFTPGATVLYVGDTDEKWAYFNDQDLATLGVTVEAHGKMPDVIIHHAAKNWLVLIEAVTSHGPIDAKRHGELITLFKASQAPLVFVTAFLSRATKVKYLKDIAWETEVWVAGAPDHMIHFNGDRFLGPYQSPDAVSHNEGTSR